MIPTLSGRWQTRILLYVVIGIPVTILFALWQAGPAPAGPFIRTFMLFLTTITVLGLILDPVYIWLQSFRWDRDWPFAYQLFFSFVEFGIVLFAATNGWLPWLDMMSAKGLAAVTPGTATLHFVCVLIPSYLALLGPLSVFLIRWRFKGAQLGKM